MLGAEWLAATIATVLSSNRVLSLNGGSWRRAGLIPETALLLFVLLTAGWLVRQAGNLRLLLRAATIAAMLVALYGIAQYFGLDPLLPPSAYEEGEGPFRIVRPPGTLGHADYLADWLVLMTFAALALSNLEQGRWRRVALAGSGLSALAIFLSGTRAGLLGLLIGAMAFLAVRRGRMDARAALLGVACIAVLTVFFFSPPGAKLRARLHWSIEDARGGARLPLWRDSLRMAAVHPVAGFGPETFGTAFPRYESLQLARAYPDFYQESPHNIFLDALAERGILGLASLLALSGLACWAAVAACRSRHPLGAPLAAALAGALVAQQFSAFVSATSLYFHLLVAMLVVISLPKPPAVNPSIAPRWVLPLNAAVSLLLIGFAVRMLVADRDFAIAEQRIAAGDVNGATAAYGAALRWQLPGASADLAYSRAMQQLASRTPIFATRLAAGQQALESAIRALATAEDRQNAWYNLATLLAARNDPTGVEHALRNAIAWSPNWFKPHWTLAQFLELANRHDEALAEAKAAVDRDGNHDPEVAQTWNNLQHKLR